MKIDAVEFFYLSMPEILDIGDGSQDLLLVRIIDSTGAIGWGECEAAPLVSIASLICPKSHSACKAVADSVVGQRIDSVLDISRIGRLVHQNSMDVLQADHTLSGIDIALWDLLGRRLNEPVYKLLGYPHAYPKMPYASLLFGDKPQHTLDEAKKLRPRGSAPSSLAGVHSAAQPPRRITTSLPPPARGLGLMEFYWWMPARYGPEISRRPRLACMPSKNSARPGLRSRSVRGSWRNIETLQASPAT